MKSGSIVFTNDNCIGCNKCIKVCSAIGACISIEENGKARIDVDPNKCVACGSCLDVCVHGAREFSDDTERFFDDLKNGENISLLLAPAFQANYPDEYKSVLGGLKKLGVNRILSVSFGADITTWGYLNYIKDHDFLGGISQPCPALVSYIERYLPELLPKLFPVQSPLMCAAIYARKKLGINDKFAFISPCIAKKLEIEDPHNKGLVQYNVTFEHLMKYVHEHNIEGEGTDSETEYGLGAFYPTPGGLAENVRWFLGDSVYIRQIEGERRLYEWLHLNEDRITEGSTPFLFIDALNCEKGCICGTAVNPEKSRTDDALYTLLDIRENAKKMTAGDAWSKCDTPEQRLERFNSQFAGLDLNDFLRGYTDRSDECRYETPSEEELDRIFISMNKLTPESRKIDCTCCGYESCTQMATAIHNGFNHRSNCIYYEKTMVRELEIEKAVAEEASRAKNSFLANMSHEIRTPINSVMGINEMILRESTDPNITTYSEHIRNASASLLGLVNNILDFTALETGSLVITPADYDLSDTVKGIYHQMLARSDYKGLKIEMDIDPNTPNHLNGDETRIRQIIANILTNAIKYTEKGGITFKVGFDRVEDDHDSIMLKIAISDTGIGIKPDDISRLYNKFDRIEEKRNRNIEGTGIGMNITQGLLEMMGSELKVESVYGSGSTFSFDVKQKVNSWMPIGDPEDSYQKNVGQRKAYRERFTAPEADILVVDDNLMNLMVFKSRLKQTCVRIDSANDGFEALDMMNARKYDMIFLDHMMPDKDGIETLHEMKANAACPNIGTPTVCLTANAIAGAKDMYISEGFDNYLSKPVEAEKLEEMLLQYLPEDKVRTVSGEASENIADEPGEDERLSALNGSTEVNILVGISNSGSVQAYLPLLKVFYESIDEKADELERFYNEGDIKDYTIKVHALKSSARLIGALELGDEAQRLENAGKSEDLAYIGEHQAPFIEAYRKYKDILSVVFDKEEEDESGKPEADASIMAEVFEEIGAAAEDLDCERLENVFEEMKNYRIPDEHKELFGKLKKAAAEFDYDAVSEILGSRG
ncbi:MAG: response regulator [Lachnospiraceae bacterium]|nr:response regulator [Lachnospiraceae bacterium]